MGLFQKRSSEAFVDLRDEAPAPRQRWGQPGRCPECSGVGYLDHIDMIDRLMHQHCTECNHKWVTSQAELATTSA